MRPAKQAVPTRAVAIKDEPSHREPPSESSVAVSARSEYDNGMTFPKFDTLEASDRLREEGGFDETQARALVGLVASGMGDTLATKADLASTGAALIDDLNRVEIVLRGDMGKLETTLRSDMEKLETSVRSDMEKIEVGIRSDMERLETTLRGDMERLETDIRNDMEKLRNDMEKNDAALRSDIRALAASIDAKIERTQKTTIIWLCGTIAAATAILATLIELV